MAIPDGEYASNFANGINDTGLPVLPTPGPSWANPVNNPAAYGSVPGPSNPVNTAVPSTAAAISAGQTAASQLPQYNTDISNIGANIASETAGQLPASVLQQLGQAGAERGVAIGSPGSPNSNAAALQALGLNSLQLTNTGEQNLNSELQSLPGYELSQNAGLAVTPGQGYEAANTNAIYASAPNPYLSAMAGLGAAKQGVGAGAGMVRGGGGAAYAIPANPMQLGAPSAPDPNLGLTYNGVTYPSGVAPTDYGQILARYNDTVTGDVSSAGQPGGAYDPETGTFAPDSGTADEAQMPAYAQ